MRLVHLSDLHLGRTLGGFDLSEDQDFILKTATAEIEARKPDLLIIAGDIYDRPIPPVEAIRLFDRFLNGIKSALPGISIVVIPGNHDSAGRLGFGSSLLADSGLRIVTEALDEPALVLESPEGRTAVWALPFLTYSSAPWRDLDPDCDSAPRSQARLMELALGRIAEKRAAYSSNILAAHCFAAGGRTGDTETAYIGLAEQVGTSLFGGFDYVALGHLHSVQSPDPGIWYSGTPLATSVSEGASPKGFLSVEMYPGAAPEVEFVPLEPLRKVRRLQGRLEDLVPDHVNFIEVFLMDEEIVLGARDRLAELYPRILSVRQLAYERRFGSAQESSESAFRGDPLCVRAPGEPADPLSRALSDFVSFYGEMEGAEPPEAMISLFQTMAKEASNASD